MESNPLAGAVPAASWSLLLGQVGQACVILALVFQLLSTALWWASGSNPKLERWGKASFIAGGVGFVLAFAVVVTLFVNDQFQFKYVFGHGAADNELQYKIAGTWSGQEGSFLLWGVMSALFGMIAAPFTGIYRRWFTIAYAPFLAAVAAILAYESPFLLRPLVDGVALIPKTGQGMPPSLLNYWMVIHPPTIFAGFGSLTVLFAMAVAALVTKNLVDWIAIVRPWALISLGLLGVGLAMGGFWAYETLGWGGFWAWDPVENTSFVPWVTVAAFLHGLFVQVSRKKWYLTNALLAGLPFLLFCYGTFLTRSGYLGDTSVHSFAEMNRSALRILIAMIGLGFATFFVLWGYRATKSKIDVPTSKPMVSVPINRETILGIGIWLLLGIGIVTAIGMSVPVMQSLSGQKPKVVEEPLYNTVLSFLFLPLMLFMAIGPFLTWKGLGFRVLLGRFVNVFSIAIGLVGCILYGMNSGLIGMKPDFSQATKLFLTIPVNRVGWVMVLTWFCLFGIVATMWKLIENFKRSKSGIGGMVTHLGVGVSMLGLIFSRGLEQVSVGPTGDPMDKFFVISPVTGAEQMGYTFKTEGQTSNFVDRHNKVKIAMTKPAEEVVLLDTPAKKLSITRPAENFNVSPGLYFNGINEEGKPTPMIWPAIHSKGFYDLYLVLYDLTFDASGETVMKAGEDRLLKDERVLVTYHGLRTEGPLGQAGAKFFAHVSVKTEEGKWDVEPVLTLGDHGPEQTPAKVGDKWQVSLVGMNVNDKSVTLQIKYREPAYVAELYYKPLTLLVWWGIGIMTVGAGITAWTRRNRKGQSDEPIGSESEPDSQPQSQE